MGASRSAKREDPAARRRMDKASRRYKIVRDREREKRDGRHVRIYPDPVFDEADHIDY